MLPACCTLTTFGYIPDLLIEADAISLAIMAHKRVHRSQDVSGMYLGAGMFILNLKEAPHG